MNQLKKKFLRERETQWTLVKWIVYQSLMMSFSGSNPARVAPCQPSSCYGQLTPPEAEKEKIIMNNITFLCANRSKKIWTPTSCPLNFQMARQGHYYKVIISEKSYLGQIIKAGRDPILPPPVPLEIRCRKGTNLTRMPWTSFSEQHTINSSHKAMACIWKFQDSSKNI